MTLMSPARAADLAEEAHTSIRTYFQHIANRCGPDAARATADAIASGTDLPPMPWLRPDQHQVAVQAAQDAVMGRHWARYRTVYTVDTTLAEELAKTDPDDRLPGGRDLLKQLPHIDPFVALPEPIEMFIPQTKEWCRFIGAYIYGTDARGRLLSTADPEATRIGLMFCGRIIDEQGRHFQLRNGVGRDWLYSRMSLPEEGMRMGPMITDVHDRFVRGTITAKDRDMPDPKATVAAMIGQFLPVLIYLCAANAERRTAPTIATKKRADGAARDGKKPPRVVEHGYHLGQRLLAVRREVERHAVPGGHTDRRMRPHVRKAHFHQFRAGKGRVDLVVHWLPPIPINADDGDTDKPTIVRVGRP
jgi:hypothetical protein